MRARQVYVINLQCLNVVNRNFFLGFHSHNREVNIIHSVVNDRSPHTLESVICDIIKSENDERNSASVVVKTVCERYLSSTAVCAFITAMNFTLVVATTVFY